MSEHEPRRKYDKKRFDRNWERIFRPSVKAKKQAKRKETT